MSFCLAAAAAARACLSIPSFSLEIESVGVSRHLRCYGMMIMMR